MTALTPVPRKLLPRLARAPTTLWMCEVGVLAVCQAPTFPSRRFHGVEKGDDHQEGLGPHRGVVTGLDAVRDGEPIRASMPRPYAQVRGAWRHG